MQHLSFVLFQLDEARRYIQDGRVQHLRLALLLLDNAAEIQMDRRIRDDLEFDELKERLRANILDLKTQRPQAELPQDLKEILGWTPLTSKEREKAWRFNEKVDYLSPLGGCLDRAVVVPLKRLHKYRNEAYHQAKIRTETLRTATLILLEINCQLLTTVYRSWRWMDSGEDYSWIQERFACDPIQIREDKLSSIADQIRSELLPGDDAVARILADHLKARLLDLDEALEFIVKNTTLASNKEEALSISQRESGAKEFSAQPRRPSPNESAPKYTLRSIETLAAQLQNIHAASNRVNSFAAFASVEEVLEPIELGVNALADKIDEAIQVSIDIARGK